METIRLGELTREDVRRVAPSSTVVIPTGAIEQHGPHLPIDFDARVCVHLSERAAEQARQHIASLVAPPISYGISDHHKPHPGVLSLSPQTYQAVLLEIGACLAESGFKRIAIINAHGGNQEANAVVARELRNRHRVSAAAASYWTLAQPALSDELSKQSMNYPGHAGKFETSLLLAIDESLVRIHSAPEGEPISMHRHSYARGAALFIAGKRQGDNEGYSDQPSAAHRPDGLRYLDAIIGSLASFLVSFHKAHPD